MVWVYIWANIRYNTFNYYYFVIIIIQYLKNLKIFLWKK